MAFGPDFGMEAFYRLRSCWSSASQEGFNSVSQDFARERLSGLFHLSKSFEPGSVPDGFIPYDDLLTKDVSFLNNSSFLAMGSSSPSAVCLTKESVGRLLRGEFNKLNGLVPWPRLSGSTRAVMTGVMRYVDSYRHSYCFPEPAGLSGLFDKGLGLRTFVKD
jgi:hypothetical protein